jgi:uncharacterized protein YjbI with pentapeptide repeats
MNDKYKDSSDSKLKMSEDGRWEFNKRQGLWIPQHKKGKWEAFRSSVPFEWFNLLGVLAIPFVVLVIGLYATSQITQQQIQSSERQHQTDIEIANEQQQEDALKSYLDDMTSLILDQKLGSQTVTAETTNNEVTVIARAKTLTVLSRLSDPYRKAAVVQFLFEAHLIGYIPPCSAHVSCPEGGPPPPAPPTLDLKGANLNAVNLSGVNLIGIDLRGTSLDFADFNNTDLTYADLSDTHLDHANLRGANLWEAELDNADLSDTDLSHSNMPATDLSLARLSHANLSYISCTCNLFYTDLSYANLSGADLSTASLSHANLRGATLSGADLSYADLSHAFVTLRQLDTAKSIKGVTMPNGSIHP